MLALGRGDCAIAAQQLDSKPMLLNCPNGTLDLRSGQLGDHDPKNLITKTIATAYDQNAACPIWLRCLHRIMGDDAEMVGFLQRAIGYSITGDTSEECFFVLHGMGANGKSTFLSLIRALLGPLAMKLQVDPQPIADGEKHVWRVM
jgi:putative DNA primase/helicase